MSSKEILLKAFLATLLSLLPFIAAPVRAATLGGTQGEDKSKKQFSCADSLYYLYVGPYLVIVDACTSEIVAIL